MPSESFQPSFHAIALVSLIGASLRKLINFACDRKGFLPTAL
jgi:hypothetical protein